MQDAAFVSRGCDLPVKALVGRTIDGEVIAEAWISYGDNDKLWGWIIGFSDGSTITSEKRRRTPAGAELDLLAAIDPRN